MNSDHSRRHGNGSEDDAATRSARVESVFLSYAEPDDALVKKQPLSTLPLRVNQRQQSLPQQHQQPSRVAAALQSSNAARRPQQQHPPVPSLNLRNNSNLANIPSATMPTSSSSLPPRSLQHQPHNQHMPVAPRSAGIPISPSMPSPSFLHQQQQHTQYMAQPHPQQRQIPGSASAPHLQDPRWPLQQPQHPSQLRQPPHSQSHAPPRSGPVGQQQFRPMHPQQGPQRPQIPIVQVTLPPSHATPPRYPQQQHPHSPQPAQMKGSTSPRAVFAAPPSPSGSVEGSDETLVDSPHSARDGPKASFASPKAPAVAHPKNDRLAPATPRLGGNKDFWKRFSTVVHQKEAREHNAHKLSGSASDSSLGEKPATRVPVSTGVSSEWLDQQQHKQKKWKIWVWLFAALIVAGIAGSRKRNHHLYDFAITKSLVCSCVPLHHQERKGESGRCIVICVCFFRCGVALVSSRQLHSHSQSQQHCSWHHA